MIGTAHIYQNGQVTMYTPNEDWFQVLTGPQLFWRTRRAEAWHALSDLFQSFFLHVQSFTGISSFEFSSNSRHNAPEPVYKNPKGLVIKLLKITCCSHLSSPFKSLNPYYPLPLAPCFILHFLIINCRSASLSPFPYLKFSHRKSLSLLSMAPFMCVPSLSPNKYLHIRRRGRVAAGNPSRICERWVPIDCGHRG